MEQLETMSSADLKEGDSLLHSEEHFTGFEINDDLLEMIENKKKSIKRGLSKETGISRELEELSECHPVNNTNRTVQSKSNISPETNDTKPSRNVNKRLKKDNLKTEVTESNIQHSLEFTTPTFNLTSTPKNRRSVARKVNVDISDPIFKLPFEHGWKRELVYRTSSDSTAINRNNRNGDVYYYSPNNRKLRSLREIQEQLDIYLTDTSLTIDSFTFLKQPIGMDDRSKEIIRDANTKLSKEDSFIGVAVKSKKSKTPSEQPYDYELSDNENNKSSTKIKIVFKDTKPSRSKSKKNSKSNLEATNTSTLENTFDDCQTDASPKLLPLQTDDVETNTTDNERRLSTSDGEVIMQAPCGIRCPNTDEPATLMCTQCLVYYHPACVNLNANLKIVGYVCVNCRSSIRHRNNNVQPSHAVVIGVSEPEQQRIEPIRIRQVNQESDTPNFFIDRTPIYKTDEEPNYEIDESINEENSVLNTVSCQGKDYKTVMVEGSFHEQYVYEMKQTRGPSLMICVVQEPKNLDEHSEMNGSLREIPVRMISDMQSFNYLAKSMRHIFSYLNVKELLSASRVCTTWNMIAMDKSLWQNVRLKNSLVFDWDKFVATIVKQDTISIDTKRMLIPSKNDSYIQFWLSFANAIKTANQLKAIELYRCPTHVIEDIIYSLLELKILNASSIKNPSITKESKNNEFMTLNLSYLSSLLSLTELRLKGLSGIKLTSLPSFEKLVNLKILSLTSIKSFPKDVCSSLDTITTGLEVLEIGDCDCLSKDFAVSLQRFVNLTSLRLENCCGRWENIAEDVFNAIRSLEKLKILELINIEFITSVEEGLEKCVGIRSLLIIPAYVSQSATTNCHLIDCLKKLSKTLTHLVWGLTHELLRVTDLFITQYQQNQHTIGYNLELPHLKISSNNIPILRTRKSNQRSGTEPNTENDVSDNVDILSVPALEKLLDTMMPDAKTKVIKVPFSGTTRIFLCEHFNDL